MRRVRTSPILRRWAYWLKRLTGVCLAVVIVLGWHALGTAAPSSVTRVLCADWVPMTGANFGGSDVDGGSTVYFRTCNSRTELMRVDNSSGHAEYLNDQRDRELHFRWDLCPSAVAVERCRT